MAQGKSLEQELSAVLAVFGVVLAPVAGSAGAHPAIHCRSLASRRRTSLLVPPLATSGKTTHRFTLSGFDSAYGRRELSLGRAADPRRIAEARNHDFGTHRLAVSSRASDDPVTNLAYILREPPRGPDAYLAGDVRGCARRGHRRRPLVTCCFAQLRRSMRHAPRFTGRASTGVVRSSPRPPARVSAKITFRTAQKRARAAVVTHRHLPLQPASRRPCRFSFVRNDGAFATDGSGRSVYPRVLGRLQFWVSTTRRTIESFSPDGKRLATASGGTRRCRSTR